MLIAYCISQCITFTACYLLVTQSIPQSRVRKIVLGTVYVILCVGTAMSVKLLGLYIIDILRPIWFLLISTLLLGVSQKQYSLEIFLRYSIVFSIVTASVQFTRITTHFVLRFILQCDDSELIYKIALFVIGTFLVLICRSRAVTALLDKLGRNLSKSIAVFSLIASIVLCLLIQFIFEGESNHEMRAVFILSAVAGYIFIAAIVIAWVVAECRFYSREKHEQSMLHQYRHVVECAAAVILSRRDKQEIDEEKEDEILQCEVDLRIDYARQANIKDLASTGIYSCNLSMRKFAARCRDKGVQFKLIVRDSLRDCVQETGLKVTELQTIFGNLIDNAIDAVSPGGEIEVMLSRNGEGIYEIMVSDNGEAIKPHVIARWGEEGLTTKKTGHGYGVRTILSALKPIGASFYLYQPCQSGEHKCLGVRFDGKNEYVRLDMRDRESVKAGR